MKSTLAMLTCRESYKKVKSKKKWETKTNFIKKRGGFENYEALVGKKVVVVNKIKEKKEGWIVLLKLEDGGKFFGVYPTIEAHLEKAIEKGELEITL